MREGFSVVRHLSETNVCQADVPETGDEMDAKVALLCILWVYCLRLACLRNFICVASCRHYVVIT